MKKQLLSFLFIFITITSFGQGWSAVGNGTSGPGNVYSLSIYQGKIYAASSGISACTLHCSVLYYTGKGWASPDSGITGSQISASLVYNNKLILGGIFYSPSINIAVWNDTTWTAMGNGTTGTNALVVYNGNIYSGGNNDFEVWKDTAWEIADNGAINSINALIVYNGKLYAGGQFMGTDGVASYIATWTGKGWAAVGSGINGTIYSLAVANNKLYVGGVFDSAGGTSAQNIAVWNDTAWAALGKGVNNTVYAITSVNGTVYAGGQFDSAGSIAANYIASWNGLNWAALGTGLDAQVNALVSADSTLYVGGDFTTAGGKSAPNIAIWKPYPLAINKVENNNNITVYPNPGNGTFNFTAGIRNENLKIIVYNELGENIYSSNIPTSSRSAFSINLTHQPVGIYLYKISDDKGNFIKAGRLIIAR